MKAGSDIPCVKSAQIWVRWSVLWTIDTEVLALTVASYLHLSQGLGANARAFLPSGTEDEFR